MPRSGVRIPPPAPYRPSASTRLATAAIPRAARSCDHAGVVTKIGWERDRATGLILFGLPRLLEDGACLLDRRQRPLEPRANDIEHVAKFGAAFSNAPPATNSASISPWGSVQLVAMPSNMRRQSSSGMAPKSTGTKYVLNSSKLPAKSRGIHARQPPIGYRPERLQFPLPHRTDFLQGTRRPGRRLGRVRAAVHGNGVGRQATCRAEANAASVNSTS